MGSQESQGKQSNRAQFARVLVEMDLSKEILEGVGISNPEGSWFQQFVYLRNV